MLGGEGVGRAGRQDQVVGLDVPRAGHRRGGAPDSQGGAVDDPPAGQQVVVGQEDPLGPFAVDGGAQRGGVVDEGVLLLDEGDLGDIVKSLGGDDAAVPSSDNGDARHVCPSDSQYSQRCSQWRVDVLSR